MDDKLLAEKLEKGWIHAKIFFEVLSGTEDAAKSAMDNHMKTVGKMENLKIVDQKISDIQKVENPTKTVKEGFSLVAEVEIVVSTLENLLYSVIFFGPSSIEIIEPKEFKVGQTSAQAMVNSVAEVMHRYAAGGAGGIVISTKK